MAKTAVLVAGGVAALVVGVFAAALLLGGVPEALQRPQVEPVVADAQESVQSRNLDLVDIFEMSESGVVRIEVDRGIGNGTGGLGSGIVFDDMGHVVTNAHVVDNATEVVVTFIDGRAYDASIVGMDAHTDLAVVKVDADPNLLDPLPIGDSSALRVGERISAIGNPFGLSGSMTSGIVSQLDRRLPAEETGFSIPDVIQTDAAINPGNSGGPLLNMRGEVIGVNTAIQSRTGEFAGIGFAVPSQTLVKIVPTLIQRGEYDHPWIGVSGTDINPRLAGALNLTDTRGFLVMDVVEDSPAERAGLVGSNRTVEYRGEEFRVGGDIITMVDDTEVRKISDILIHLQRVKAVGDELRMQVLRDGEYVDVVLVLDKRPDSPQ